MLKTTLSLDGPASAGGGHLADATRMQVSREFEIRTTLKTPADLEALKAAWAGMMYSQVEELTTALFADFMAKARQESPKESQKALPPVAEKPNAGATKV